MPLPYTTTSPPPTSGALTVVDRANISSAPYGGGGGGSIGPNPSVSSLTVNLTGAITFANDNSWDTGGLAWNTNAAGTSSLALNPSYAVSEQGQSGPNLVCLGLQLDTAGGQTAYPLAASGIYIQGPGYPAAAGSLIISDPTDAGTTYVSSLRVSSINGQIPGGAAANPNLSVSSLTVNNTAASPGGAIAFVYDTQGSLNPLPASAVGLTENVIKDSAGTDTNAVVAFINSGGANLLSDFGAGRVLVGAQGTGSGSAAKGTIAYDNTANLMTLSPASVSSLTVSSINGAAPGGGGGPPPAITSTISSIINLSTINYGSPGLLNIAGGVQVADYLGAGTISTLRLDSIVPGGSVAIPLVVLSTVAGNVNMSTLTVSSINGAAYPPPAGGMLFSSIAIPGGTGSAFNSDPNVLNQVVTWPIIPNHVYNVNVDCRVQANAPTVTDGDNVYIEVLPNGGTTQAMDTAWGVQVSTLTANGVYTQVGGSALFKAPVNAASTCALGILGSFSTTVRVDSITYVDMGVI